MGSESFGAGSWLACCDEPTSKLGGGGKSVAWEIIDGSKGAGTSEAERGGEV